MDAVRCLALKSAFNVKQVNPAFDDLARADFKAVFAQKGKVLFGRPFVGELDSDKGQYFLPQIFGAAFSKDKIGGD